MKCVNQEGKESTCEYEVEKLSSDREISDVLPETGFADDPEEGSFEQSGTSAIQRIADTSFNDSNTFVNTSVLVSKESSLVYSINRQTISPPDKCLKSDQEDEANNSDFFKKKKKTKLKRQVLDDSDGETLIQGDLVSSYTETNHSKDLQLLMSDEEEIIEEKNCRKKKIRQPVLDDSDTEEENIESSSEDKVAEAFHTSVSYKSMFENTDLYDAEGSSEEESPILDPDQIQCNSKQEKHDSKGLKKKSALPRKSKQSALEEIHSETQRLIRHSRVALPYHQPKQRSLSEFLSRRKVVPMVPLKTSSDQLCEVWKSIEEREKIAEEFYKSESECSEDENRTFTLQKKNSDNISQNFDRNKASIKQDQSIEVSEINNSLMLSSENSNENLEQNFANISPECVCQSLADTNVSDSSNTAEEHSKKEFVDIMNISPTTTIQVVNESSECPESESFSENTEDFKLVFPSEKENENTEEDNLIIHSNVKSDSLSSKLSSSAENSDKLDMKKKRCSLFNNTLLDVKLDVVPKISGKPDEIIDLEKVVEKPAALKLVSRFMKHVSLKPKFKKQEEKIAVAITEVNEKGEVVNLSEEILNIKTSETTKPGETRVQLKAKLKQKMAQNREEQFVKRIEEYKLNEEMFEGEKEVCSDVDVDEEDIEPPLSSETESEPEENDLDLSKENFISKENPFIDEEAEESENEENEEGGESAEDVADDDDSSSDSASIDVAPLINNKDEASNIMDIDNQASTSGLGSRDLLALCSGVFPSQAVSLKDLEKNDNIEPEDKNDNAPSISQSLALFLPEDGTLDICGSQGKPNHEGDDSDDDILPKKAKKKIKLEFSDDEDDDNTKLSIKSSKSNKSSEMNNEDEILNEEETEDLSEEEVEDVKEEEDEVLDEEEEDLFQNPSAVAKRFLEDEAELSGSEYGSADEDEVDLDNYEEEQGDKDNINQKKLRDELGKIHMKEIMDEDKREIRILQELLLEDGELHSDGPKRQRQFKWYNQDDMDAEQGIFLSALEGDDIDGDGSKEITAEQEEDESWRKTRLERENYLREMQNIDDDFDMIQHIKKFNKLDKPAVKPSPKPQTLTSPNPKKQFSLITKRGSFLNRGEKLLSRLAEMTNISNENQLGNSRGKKNMVFAVVSPPKEEPIEQVKKRKSETSLPKVTKRLKFSPGNINLTGRKSIFENLD